MKKIAKLAKSKFGIKKLKDKQLEILTALLEKKRDVCAVLATGYGKSLCYQLPSVFLDKIVLVVSPLVALMEDQRIQLEAKEIPVCCLNGNNWNKSKDERELLDGENKLVYITPEHLASSEEFVEDLVAEDRLGLIAIDESHCISTWGLDFRPSYLALGYLKQSAPKVPILALTATATAQVRKDICTHLQLEKPLQVTGGFNRPNLSLTIRRKGESPLKDLLPLLKTFRGKRKIIYCKTRAETEELTALLWEKDISCRAYHAGLSAKKRQLAQERFISGRTKAIIATIAFGLGIDVPDIRLLIHYGTPGCLEAYYQEVGRAGRDGKPSTCVLFYSSKDLCLSRFLLKSIENPEHKRHRTVQVLKMEKFLYSSGCRRKAILEHFGEDTSELVCNNCDNCQKKTVKEEFSQEAHLLFQFLSRFNDRYGAGTIIKTLRGSKAKAVHFSLQKLKVHGEGKYWKEDKWKAFLQVLLAQGYIQGRAIQDSFGTAIAMSSKGWDWYKPVKEKLLRKEPLDGGEKLYLQLTENFLLLKKKRK